MPHLPPLLSRAPVPGHTEGMTELLGYSARQVRDAEEPHLAAGEPLMARAAAALADEIRRVLGARPGRAGRAARVLLLVGAGNNGGDALYAGAELARAGIEVVVFPALDRVHVAGLEAALAAGARRVGPDELEAAAAAADLLVDGLVGTGSSGALRGPLREAVASVLPVLDRPSRPAVVAVDIPSGIDPDTGEVPGAPVAGSPVHGSAEPDGAVPVVLPADLTVTFGGIKGGLLLPPARDLAGRVVLVDLGLGPQLAEMTPLVRLRAGVEGESR
ncbi:MAG: NAD(P)H-hydrate epimerase [Naasia sp.]|nr:NAD(P)H-hydrate epimerase [Naasia sp.]